jgi:WD40 repeat protein
MSVRPDSPESDIGSSISQRQAAAAAQQQTAADHDGDVVALELEHALGFTQCLQGLSFHPTAPESVVVYGCGKLLVVLDLGDCHEQHLLRGHDARVTCVDYAPSGLTIASGQKRSIDGNVYFNIWDSQTFEVKMRVRTPHTGQIDTVRFSPDDGMIATTGAEGTLCVWDSATGRKVASYADGLSGDEAKSVCWGEIQNPGTRNQQYWLFVPFNTGVRRCTLTFDVKTLGFVLECVAFVLPGAGGRMGGYVRKYLCCGVLGEDLLCGTSSGDVLVFNNVSGVYRTALSLCANGVHSLVACPAYNCIVVGGGDGLLRKITGEEKNWTLIQQAQLEGHIISATVSADQHQIVVMTSAGLIYTVLTKDLSYAVASESPLGALSDIALPLDGADSMASCSDDGVLRVWNTSTYKVTSSFSLATGNRSGSVSDVAVPTCCAFDPVQAGVVVAGWSDGRLRAVDCKGRAGTLLWAMSNGHQGSIHSVRLCPAYIVSGGADSCVRVWSRDSRELVAQMQEHKKNTTMIAIDGTTDNIVHSISHDMALFSFDLTKVDNNPNVKQPKRVATHSDATSGGFLCMTQRVDCEREMFVGTVEGKILAFDLDYPTPVLTISDCNRQRVTAMEVSPDGKYLCAGLGDGSLAIYGLRADRSDYAKLLLHAVCHSTAVVRCVWSRDARQIVSAGADGELIIWNFYTASQASIGA